MEIFSLVGSILLKDNDVKNKLKDVDNTAKQTGSTFDSTFGKIVNSASKLGRNVGAVFDNLDKKFQLWMEDNKKSASNTEINNKALENYKGKLEALSQELEKSQKALKGVADEFGKDSTEYKEAENHVMDLQLKYKQLEDESKKLQKANDSINFKKIADGAISVGSAMTMKFTTPILAAFGLAAKSATSFEHQMADIRKEVVASGIPISQVNSLMKEMSQDSIKWSEDFGQSTDDINQGLLTLVKDGYSGSEAMKIMKTSLYTARGANEDLATVIDQLGSSLEAYGMKTNNAAQTTNNMSKMADAFAYVSNHTKASITSLGEAASVMGSTFTALKIPMTQGAAAIGELQSNGIDASTAANALKAGLVNLVHPSKQMSAAMKEMNLQVFDSKGQMKDLPTILDNIQKGTQGWTDKQKQAAIATVFGKESLSTWNVLIHKGGGYLRDLSTHAGNATGEVKKLSDSMKDTPANKFKELKESVHALAVSFGQDVLPSLMPLVNGITSLIKHFSNLNDGTKKFIVTTLALVAGLGPVILVFGKTLDTIIKLHQNIGKLQQGFTRLGGISGILGGALKALPFIAVVAGIAAAIAIGYELYKHWDQMKAKAGELKNSIATHFNNIKTSIANVWNSIKTSTINVWNGIKTSVLGVWNTLKTSVTTIFNSIKTVIVAVWNEIKAAIMAVIRPIVNGVINLFNSMKTGIFNIFNGFKTFFTGIWQAIKTIFLGAVLLILDLVTGNFTKLSQDAQLIWNDLKTAFSNIWNGIKEIFTGALQAIAAFLSTEWEGIKNITSTVWNGIKTFLSDLWNSLKSIASTAWNAMKEAISSIVTNTGEGIKNIWNGILNWFKSLPSNLETLGRNMFDAMKNGISSVLSTIGGVVRSGFDDAINFLKNLPSEALQWGKDFIQGLINGIKSMIDGVGDTVKSVADTIRSYLHFSRPDEGPLHDYETWMPDFMQGLADGITKNKGIITKAMQGLTGAMSLGSGNSGQSTQYGQNLNKSLGKGLSDSQDKVTKPVDTLNTTITTKMATLVQSFIQHGQNSDTNLGNGITTNSDATINPLTTLITTITTGIKTFVQSCIQHGQNTDTNLGNGITNKSGDVINAANKVTTTVGNNLDTFAKGSVKYGQETDTSIGNGVSNTIQTVVTAVTSVTTKMGDILKSFASSCVSIGQSIGDSIGQGIRSSEDNVVSIAHELTQKIINAFTGPDGFDIHSPSRKLFEIGAYVIQGFINGLSSQDVLAFFQNKISGMMSVAGDVSKWLSMALMLTGTPMSWLPGLLKLTSYESGDPGTLGSGDPTLVNSIPVGNEYATGLLQMLPSTFAEFMQSGFGNIMNPIDNAIAAIRYIKSRYGSVFNTPLFTSGGSYMGYEKGTNNATEGTHPVAENGFEIVLGKALRWFSGGETVLNNSDSMNLLNNIKNAVETVKSLGNMSFSSIPTIKTQETESIENKNIEAKKQPVILKLVLQNGRELAEYMIDDINKLQGEIQLSKNRVALGRR